MATVVRAVLLLACLALVASLAAGQNCVNPCTNLDTTCQMGVCDNAVCKAVARDPLPKGCCVNDGQCNDSDSPCQLGECDKAANQCNFRTICSASAYEDPDLTCRDDSDCGSLDNPCVSTKCIGQTCIIGGLPSSDPRCCNHAEDCAPRPCTAKFCDVTSHTCFYRHQAGCTITEETESLPSTLLQTSSPSPPSDFDNQAEPGIGDIIGAIIGFIILGILVLAFIVVVIMMIIQKAVRQLKGDS